MVVVNNLDDIKKTQLTKILKKSINNNPDLIKRYKKGQKGLIGFFLKDILEKTTYSFNTKKIKQELIIFLKQELNKN